jgi:hypothetical protein
MARELVDVKVRWRGEEIDDFTSQVDPADPRDIQGLLEDSITHDPESPSRDGRDYSIKVLQRGTDRELFTHPRN